jgi:DNA-binding transcriptional LysR family regulator
VAPAVDAYLATYPEVSVDVTLNDRYIDLLAEGVDLALRIGRLADSSLIARRLAPIRFAACAAPRYLERHGIPETPEDLTRHDCLLYTYAATVGEWRFTGPDGGDRVVRVGGPLLANNGDVLMTAALDGLGIALAPSFMAGEHVQARRLVTLLPGYVAPEVGLYAVYPPGRHLSAKLRTFVDFLVRRFGDEPEWDRWCREDRAATAR